MATPKPNLDLDNLHALVGRMLSHGDELAGRPELPADIARDVHVATTIIDALSQFLEAVAGKLPPPSGGDLPQSSRASHYS